MLIRTGKKEKGYAVKIKIVYEDAAFLVCYKPAGLAVQTAVSFQEDAVSELKNYLSKKKKEKMPYLGIVHRLDQPVEGLLVFAKTPKAAAVLTKQLAEGELAKKYLAVLCGVPEIKSSTLTNYLKKEGKAGRASVVSKQTPDAKRAELCYRILAEKEIQTKSETQSECQGIPCSLAEITIKTGRFHQIRAQMSHLGHPLYGDIKYGAQEKGQLALCASQLEFVNPLNGKKQKFHCKPQNPIFAQFEAQSSECDKANFNFGNNSMES